MFKKPPFENFHPIILLGIMFSIMMLSLYFFYLVGKVTFANWFNIPDLETFISSTSLQSKNPEASLFIQVLISSIALFLLPAIMMAFSISNTPIQFLKLNNSINFKQLIYALLIIFCGGFFVSLLVDLMHVFDHFRHIPFINSIVEMAEKNERNSEEIINIFFNGKGSFWLFFLLIGMGLMPALGEEFLFRGFIQQVLSRNYLSPLLAILFTSLLFGLIHFQFYNFLGLWFMGFILGLLFHFSDNLWIPIIAHAFNNMLTVTVKWLAMRGEISEKWANESDMPLYLSIPGGIAMAYFLYLLFKSSKINNQNKNNI